uniref:Vav guanine nucleotide exchange factor 1 n=1 Tax=Denticeps clupeoides TaxID=299321 RepID=A0AAY4BFB7_9TELE
MELWRQCTAWLIQCRVLPENHRVTWDSAQVCELAHALRDGVLLCQLLNNLLPHAVNLREINLRPQMSQFLCLKNIRTFLCTCQERFGMRKSEVFEAFDLFDVRDFGKVVPSSYIVSGGRCGRRMMSIRNFSLSLSDTVEEDDDLYDCVEDEEVEGDDIYEDLMKAEEPPETVRVKQSHLRCVARLLLYGRYCSQVESSTKHLDKISTLREDVRMKLEECSNRANSGRFSLRDLLMVPMQRVLKYHLLLQELMKHTVNPDDKENLRVALDAMKDLAQCVNEVKRDNEFMRQITAFQLSIENMTQSLAHFGRPKIDGEVKISTSKKSKQDRYAFLFDKAMLVCKKKSGESFELKELIDLQLYHVRDESGGERDSKKWTHCFMLLNFNSQSGFDLYFKTREQKKKWLDQFEMALSNMSPENSTANGHDFQMHSFENTTSCKACQMLLRGTFFQGYRCNRCKMPAHKECLGRVPICGRNSGECVSVPPSGVFSSPGFPKMEVCQDYYGVPPPPVAFGQPLHLSVGDVIELTRAEVDLQWWEGRNVTVGEVGWFPCNKVQPFRPVSACPEYFILPPCIKSPWFPVCRFAGNMDRSAAKNLLTSRSDGTFLVRQKDGGEFAISIKFNVELRHIKITSSEGLYRINEKKAFKGLIELVEFYQANSLKECFKDVDTRLEFPYKQPEQTGGPPTYPSKQGSSSDALLWLGVACLPAPARYFGTAKVRYDFSARDRTELSLREGDTVKILSKKASNGWWKGEVYGRVIWIPSHSMCFLYFHDHLRW